MLHGQEDLAAINLPEYLQLPVYTEMTPTVLVISLYEAFQNVESLLIGQK